MSNLSPYNRIQRRLVQQGVPPREREQLMGGLSCPLGPAEKVYVATPVLYISGPMRGKPSLNFPAFDAARDALLRQGVHAISPADIDRVSDIDETTADHEALLAAESARLFAYRDLNALMALDPSEGDGIYLLPGWSDSVGARAEEAVARWLGLCIYYDNEAERLP